MRLPLRCVACILALLGCLCSVSASELQPTRHERCLVSWNGRYYEVTATIVQGTGQVLLVLEDSDPIPVPPTPPTPPTPPVPPPPPVPPVPGKVTTVVIVEETADRTPELTRLLSSKSVLELREQLRPNWYLLDKDVVDESGKPPTKLAAYLALAAGQPLPHLVTDSDADGANGVLFSGPLPVDTAKLVEVLRGK